MWFASGIAMIYTGGMPAITPRQRLDYLSAVDLSRIHFSPAQAAERAGLGREWIGTGDGRVTLLTVMDRPAYRFGEDDSPFLPTRARRCRFLVRSNANSSPGVSCNSPEKAARGGNSDQSRPMDAGHGAAHAAAQICSRRRPGHGDLRSAAHRRRGHADNRPQPRAGLGERDSALAVFHRAPRQAAFWAVKRYPGHRVDFVAGLRAGRARTDFGVHAIQAAAGHVPVSRPRFLTCGTGCVGITSPAPFLAFSL